MFKFNFWRYEQKNTKINSNEQIISNEEAKNLIFSNSNAVIEKKNEECKNRIKNQNLNMQTSIL
jgi:hypothetical protein